MCQEWDNLGNDFWLSLEKYGTISRDAATMRLVLLEIYTTGVRRATTAHNMVHTKAFRFITWQPHREESL